MTPLHAITLRQPWASAVLWAGKDVENRGRSTSFRGRIWIHAGLGEDPAPDEAWAADYEHESPRGLIIGSVRLIDCTRLRTGSKWAIAGQYHLLLAAPEPLAEPVPCRGQVRIPWTIPEDAAALVRAQLEGQATSACGRWEFRQHEPGVWGIHAVGGPAEAVMHASSARFCQRAVDGGHAEAALYRLRQRSNLTEEARDAR